MRPDEREGPPERERPGATPSTGPIQKSAGNTHTDKPKITTRDRQCGGDTVPVQLQRRRLASYRCEPLASGHRDPWQPWRPEQLTEKQAEAAVQAAQHLIDLDLPPLFDTSTCRGIYRRGHRELAEQLHRRSSGEAA